MDSIGNEFGKADRFFEPKVVRSQVVPTRRLFWFLAAGIPVAGLGAWAGMPWLFWVYNGFFAILCLVSYRFGPNSQFLLFRRRMDAVLSVRAKNRIRVELEYEGDYALSGRLRDEVPGSHYADGNERTFSVRSGEKVTLDYTLIAPERGSEVFRGTFLRLDCPYGLIQKQILLNTEQDVKVYPNILALREFQLLNQQGRLMEMGVRKSRIKGIGTEFESLREYALGDDYRKVDWKATARRQKLIVREFEVERNQAVILCVDAGRHMMAEIDGVRKLDLVLDSVLMLIQSALTAGDNVGLLVYGADVKKYIPAKKGQGQLGILLNALYDVVAEPVESDPIRAFGYLQARHKRRSLVLHFTSVEDRDQAREMITSFGTLARTHIAVLANISDPKYRETLRHPPEDVEQLFKFASVHYVTEDRRQAMMSLRASGLHTLESEPEFLASDLVNYYIDIKSKGKL
jgi:uncharacterized protein (DUF58 family)